MGGFEEGESEDVRKGTKTGCSPAGSIQPSGKSFKSFTSERASLNHLADVRNVCIVLPGDFMNSNKRVRLLESVNGDALASRFKSDKNNVACGAHELRKSNADEREHAH